MMQCKQCGATLPDNARFCLQCGAPIDPDQPQVPQGPQTALDFIQPAIAGGMFLGFLSSIPIINAGCCLWVLLGGGMAAVALNKQRSSGITYGDGAFVGVLSGFFGAIVGTIIQMSFHVIAAHYFESQQQQVEDLLKQLGAEGPMRDWTLRVFSGEISAVTVLFTFFANLLMYALFAMIGGIVGVAMLNKRKGATSGTRV